MIHLITVCIFFSLFFDVLSFLELLSNTAAIFDMLPSVLQDLLLSNFREKLSSFTEALNGGALLQPAAASILFSERTMSSKRAFISLAVNSFFAIVHGWYSCTRSYFRDCFRSCRLFKSTLNRDHPTYFLVGSFQGVESLLPDLSLEL